MSTEIALDVNGRAETVLIDDPNMPLLYALRNNLGLRGPRFGCGLGQCGACTVHIDGQAIRSCQVSIGSIGTKKIVTLEGLGTPDRPDQVQTAFIAEQALQCGYCTNGMIMSRAPFSAKIRNHPRSKFEKHSRTICAVAAATLV